MKNTLFLILLIPFLFACATHEHRRETYAENGNLLTKEETKWRHRLMDSSASKIAVETKDGDYQRSVNAADASVLTDEQSINELSESVSNAVSEALKKFLN